MKKNLIAICCIALLSGCTGTSQENKENVTKPETEVSAENPLSPEALKAQEDGAIYFASGNEPGWSVTIFGTDDGIYFSTNYGKDIYHFEQYTQEVQVDNTLYYKAENKFGKLEMTLANTPCRDDSDKEYPMTATIQFRGESFDGCALSLIE